MDPLAIVQLVLRIALAVAFAGMGVGHFVPAVARGMRAMIPPRLRRWRGALVAATGVCELAAAAGLLIPWPLLRFVTGIALVVFLVAVFPANAVAAADPSRFGRAAIAYTPRLLLQLVLIAVVLVATAPLAGALR
ncbi:DoxX family protein [Pseudolysinimonas sp.]|uniref:DoxX family protein n=1 Tax=Pseudolysinimonas sp. TaxID=2680009 RepID=UPI003F7E5783